MISDCSLMTGSSRLVRCSRGLSKLHLSADNAATIRNKSGPSRGHRFDRPIWLYQGIKVVEMFLNFLVEVQH
jgi:hypothetical protein